MRSTLRLLIGVWWLVCLIIMCSFSGELVSMLSNKRAVDRIDTLQDLLQHRDITIMLENGGSFTSAIRKAKKGIYKQLWEVVENNQDSFHSFDQIVSDSAIEKIEKGTHATMFQTITLRTELSRRYTEKGFCNLYVGRKKFFPKISVTAMGKYLPYCFREKLKQMIAGAVENHLFGKWNSLMTANYTRCVLSPPSGVRQLTLFDLQGVFYCLVIGFIASFLAFVFEKLRPDILKCFKISLGRKV